MDGVEVAQIENNIEYIDDQQNQDEEYDSNPEDSSVNGYEVDPSLAYVPTVKLFDKVGLLFQIEF